MDLTIGLLVIMLLMAGLQAQQANGVDPVDTEDGTKYKESYIDKARYYKSVGGITEDEINRRNGFIWEEMKVYDPNEQLERLPISADQPLSTKVQQQQQQQLNSQQNATNEMSQRSRQTTNETSQQHQQSQQQQTQQEPQVVHGRKRRGVLPFFVKWPKVNGELIIPYAFDDSIPKYSQKRKRILYFIGLMNSYIKCNENAWRPRTNETFYVLFKNSTGCSSFLGRIPTLSRQPQTVNLTDDCVFENEGSVLHEMLHAMGFVHEHQRKDRDEFVNVDLSNVEQGALFNFLLFNTQSGKSPYQISSVLHYAPFTFARDPSKPVITKKDPTNTEIMGQRLGMTEIDKDQVNAFYECTPLTITELPPPTPTTTLPPITDTTLKSCNWQTGKPCKPNVGFQIKKDNMEMFIRASVQEKRVCRWFRIGYRWIYRCKNKENRVNRITLRACQSDVRKKSKCMCKHRLFNCDQTKVCVFISFRRLYDEKEKVYRDPSSMHVCLRNCRPGFDCSRLYQSVTCKKLIDDNQVRNQWKIAHFEFNARCKGIRNSVFVKKGIDRFDIRQISLTAGPCSTNNG